MGRNTDVINNIEDAITNRKLPLVMVWSVKIGYLGDPNVTIRIKSGLKTWTNYSGGTRKHVSG